MASYAGAFNPRPQQDMSILEENQLLKSCSKLRYRFCRVCHKQRDVAPPKLQVHYFIYRLILPPNFKCLALMVSEFISPNFKILALVVSEFILLNLAFKKVIFLVDVWYPQTV